MKPIKALHLHKILQTNRIHNALPSLQKDYKNIGQDCPKGTFCKQRNQMEKQYLEWERKKNATVNWKSSDGTGKSTTKNTLCIHASQLWWLHRKTHCKNKYGINRHSKIAYSKSILPLQFTKRSSRLGMQYFHAQKTCMHYYDTSQKCQNRPEQKQHAKSFAKVV